MKRLLPLAYYLGFLSLALATAYAQTTKAKQEVVLDAQPPRVMAQMDLRDWGALSSVPNNTIVSTGEYYAWLDNDRVMMGAPFVKKTAFIDSSLTVVVWNTRTQEVTRHLTGLIYCVDPVTQYVQIRLPLQKPFQTRPWAFVAGKWQGDEKLLQPYKQEDEVNGKYYDINQFTCQYEPNPNEKNSEVTYFPLRPEHGSLVIKREVKAAETIVERSFVNSKNQQVINFQSLNEEIHYSDIQYLPFSNRYFLHGNLNLNSDFSPKQVRTVRLLSTDGQLEVIEVPVYLWAKALAREGFISARVAKPGILWFYHDPRKRRFDAGMYWERQGRLERVLSDTELRGETLVVAPDGCKAVGMINKKNTVFNLCE